MSQNWFRFNSIEIIKQFQQSSNKFIISKILFLFIPLFSFSQVSFVPVNADYSVFQMNDSLAYVEFYVSFFQNNLQYEYKNDTLQASFKNVLSLKHNGTEFKKITHNFRNTVKDSMGISKYDQFYDIFAITLPFRHFNTTLSVVDNISGYSGEYVLDVNIPGATSDFTLSDLQLSCGIQKTNKPGKFVKNNIEVIPFPRKTFDLLQPMLYFYIELNNLSFDDSQQNTYLFNYFVTNEAGDTLKTGKQKTKNIAGKVQVEIGAFNALSLPAGFYHINAHAKDNLTGVNSNTRKRFYVHKPTKKKKQVQQLSEIEPIFNVMSIEELKMEFDGAQYFASKQEKDIFEQLTDAKSMRTFITSFWRNQDKANKMVSGFSRERFLKLRELSDSKYGSSMFKGYKTDRGRVLLVYGEPNEIERFPNTTDTDPYVIWKYYELAGGNEFIFVDRNGFGRYELIHSTYYKELQDHDWFNRISNR